MKGITIMSIEYGNHWNSFLNSGKISDYLLYKENQTLNDNKQQEQVSSVGENPYAGIRNGNRPCIKDATYRGI